MAKMKKNRSGGKIVTILLLIGILAGAGYIYTAPEFEREKPQIEGADNVFWNRKDPLIISLKDNVGLSSYELILSDGDKSVIVGQGPFPDHTKAQTLSVKYPKSKVLNSKA